MLSRIDNQIVTLSARSPEATLSGCTIVPKKAAKPPFSYASTTESPSLDDQFSTLPDDDSKIATTETVFDKYLKDQTTVTPTGNRDSKSLDDIAEDILNNEFNNGSTEQFNDTEVFNATMRNGSHNGGGLYYRHDVGFENVLENTTQYKSEVEELFEPSKKNERLNEDYELVENRRRRANPFTFRSNRETYIVKCHNAGSFISSRERWWFIAIANCGNNKGLDVKYRFKMTNGQSGDFWHEHFSADERCELLLEKKKNEIFD